jgi:diguanylate cyclase (GGDEF)-like protein/PAS domain S-box-containing protein
MFQDLPGDPLAPNGDGCSLLHEDGSPWRGDELPAALALASGQPQPPTVIGVRHPDGNLSWLSVTTVPVHEPSTGTVELVVSTFADITDLRAARITGAQAQARYQLLAEASADVVSVIGADDTVSYVSPAAATALGKAPEDLVGLPLSAGLVHTDEHAIRQEAFDTVRRTGAPTTYTARLLMADGTWRWMETSLRALAPDPDVTDVLAITRDIDDQHRVSTEMEQLALTDPLTGLANRAQFTGRLERMLRRAGAGGRACALVLVDLDDFKAINDTHGHQVGDQLLQAAAGRLSSGSRPSDTVARLGGDEFAVLLPGLDEPGSAGVAAARLTEVLGRPYRLAGQKLTCTASLGLALVVPGEPTEELYRRADDALYAAKEAGRHTWRQSPT